MKEYKSLQFLLGIVLAFTFLSVAVTFTLSYRPLYVHDIRELNIAESYEMTEENILQQYDALIAYNRIGGPDTLSFPMLTSSETGRIHFEEVKTIFLFFQWGVLAGLVLSAVGILFFRNRRPKRFLKYAALISLLVPAVLGVGVALFWEHFFVMFHEIMFRNDYWLFNAQTDPIINLLPDTYFMHCAVMIVALTMLSGVISLLAFCIANRKDIC